MVSAILPASSSPTRSTVSGVRWNCRLSFFTHIGIVALQAVQQGKHGGQISTIQVCASTLQLARLW